MDPAMEAAARKRLARSLRVAMRAADLTVGSLSDRSGVSRTTLYDILKERALTTVITLLNIAEHLGVTAGTLIDGIAPDDRRYSELDARLRALEGQKTPKTASRRAKET